ncbi:hypothetical protein P154DRAFT_524722 [Amniculicola lignicola CBS 123094]|uniref:Uncharacterized protein n=1 Tax=Amniculicola lignicola CBS 123094 TaxID=1392246 RepID=A0A6A5W8R0_9PLEO|nr:hypothetical protein P154DRAFT_524722 [Amniculicola lignicola CBS 123094]
MEVQIALERINHFEVTARVLVAVLWTALVHGRTWDERGNNVYSDRGEVETRSNEMKNLFSPDMITPTSVYTSNFDDEHRRSVCCLLVFHCITLELQYASPHAFLVWHFSHCLSMASAYAHFI